MKFSRGNLSGFLFLSAFLVFLIIPQSALADTISTNNIDLTCTYPGRIVEAGETVIFDLNIKNSFGTFPKTLNVDTFKGENNWKFSFYAGENKIDRIQMTEGQEITVSLEIDTAGDTPVGTYPVRVRIDDGRLWLYVTIEKSYVGKDGVLKVTVVDDQGEKIKGASISIIDENSNKTVKTVLTTADGEVRTEVGQGDYTLHVENNGYMNADVDEISIKCGYTTDAGTIMLEKKNYGLSVDVKSPLVMASIGSKPVYEIDLSNVGKSDDIFGLDVSGLPKGWYGRYKLSDDSTESVSKLFIESGATKTVFLETIPPYSVEKGDYLFNATFVSSDGTYAEDLEAKITGSSNMVIFSEKYRYDITKGDTADIPLTISNKGSGEALTNVRVEVSAPEGWNVRISPETVASIQPGEKATVYLKVTPPANIAASDYKISTKVISDQEEDTDEIRIIISESSLIGILGLILLAGACGGVYYFFRKYKRR